MEQITDKLNNLNINDLNKDKKYKYITNLYNLDNLIIFDNNLITDDINILINKYKLDDDINNDILLISYNVYIKYSNKYPFINILELIFDLYIKKLTKKKKRICINNTCSKQAGYNYENEMNRLYCSKHQLNNMISMKKYPMCIDCKEVQPTYGLIDTDKALYCLNCSKNHENIIDVKHTKCLDKDCNIRPSFNYPDEEIPIYCAKHKSDGMVDLVSSICIEEGCTKCASCTDDLNSNKRLYCIEHSKDKENIRDLVNSKCITCGKYANYNYENKTKPIYCVEHKEINMIDIKHIKCKTYLCDLQVKNKYKGYCLRCFIYTFPNEKVARNYKIKECYMTDFIKEQYSELDINYDRTISGGCSKKRPDVFIECLTHSVIIECDEEQHNTEEYKICDNKRTMGIFQDLGNRSIVFIRFNPDSYINNKNKKVDSCFKTTQKTGILVIKDNNKWNLRLNKLKETIDYYLNIENIKKEVEIIKLFYDEII
jgi:EsV-like protein